MRYIPGSQGPAAVDETNSTQDTETSSLLSGCCWNVTPETKSMSAQRKPIKKHDLSQITMKDVGSTIYL